MKIQWIESKQLLLWLDPPELVLKKGNHTKVKPNKKNYQDIRIGKKLVNNLKLKGITQGVIVVKGKIIIAEDFKGTDFQENINHVVNYLDMINNKKEDSK